MICPECEGSEVSDIPGVLPVCPLCDWTGWDRNFDPTTHPDCTPFGIPLGSVPMGTLGQVVGAERARQTFARLARPTEPSPTSAAVSAPEHEPNAASTEAES